MNHIFGWKFHHFTKTIKIGMQAIIFELIVAISWTGILTTCFGGGANLPFPCLTFIAEVAIDTREVNFCMFA